MKIRISKKQFIKWLNKNKKEIVCFAAVFLIFLFLRTYELEKRAQYTWDQVDNAWHAKNMIVNHEFPLQGMPAKADQSVTIGPAYYYFVTGFYLLTDLDPIASPIIATIISIISFLVLFWCVNKIFGYWVAIGSLILNTFSFYLITMDRIQWPVQLIAPLSLLIFVCLDQIIKGKIKYIVLLGFLLGFSLHVHFTSIFFFVLAILALPLFPRKKLTIKYALYAIPLFFVWLIPFVMSAIQIHKSSNPVNYIQNNWVGVHLRRIFQVADTAFLEIALIVGIKVLNFLKYLFVPLFCFLYFIFEKKKSYSTLYLVIIWFLVPWFALSSFRGDLSPYYFAVERYLTLMIVSYSVITLIKFKKIVFVPIVGIIFLFMLSANISDFSQFKSQGLLYWKTKTYDDFKNSRGNFFQYGAADSYIYYFYERKYNHRKD